MFKSSSISIASILLGVIFFGLGLGYAIWETNESLILNLAPSDEYEPILYARRDTLVAPGQNLTVLVPDYAKIDSLVRAISRNRNTRGLPIEVLPNKKKLYRFLLDLNKFVIRLHESQMRVYGFLDVARKTASAGEMKSIRDDYDLVKDVHRKVIDQLIESLRTEWLDYKKDSAQFLTNLKADLVADSAAIERMIHSSGIAYAFVVHPFNSDRLLRVTNVAPATGNGAVGWAMGVYHFMKTNTISAERENEIIRKFECNRLAEWDLVITNPRFYMTYVPCN
jgi:hypothetical protein